MAISTLGTRPPKRVVLHIGLHKTGTTYLQETLRANDAALRAQGVYVPATRRAPSVLRAVDDLQGRRQVRSDTMPTDGAWQRLVSRALAAEQATVVVSDERLSLSNMAAIARIGRAFAGCDLRVVVTARDPARVLVSSWEDAVRAGATWRWPDYVERIASRTHRGVNPARSFWARQDVARITAAWEALVPPESIYIVTVPADEGAPRRLFERFAEAAGVDARTLARESPRRNARIGAPGTEVIRRLNERLDGRLDHREHDRVVKYLLAPTLSEWFTGSRSVTSSEDEWLQALATEEIGVLSRRGYRVIGDLDDLRPVPRAGRRPDEVDDAELAAAALEAAAVLAMRHDTASSGDAITTRMNDRRHTKELVFAGRRAVLRAADRGGVLGRAVSLAYRSREVRQENAMRVARLRGRRVAVTDPSSSGEL